MDGLSLTLHQHGVYIKGVIFPLITTQMTLVEAVPDGFHSQEACLPGLGIARARESVAYGVAVENLAAFHQIPKLALKPKLPDILQRQALRLQPEYQAIHRCR